MLINWNLVRASIRSRGRSVDWSWGWGISWSWGRGISSLGSLSWEDSLSFIFDISNKSILISSVGHNLCTRVGKGNTVRSAGPVSITALRVSKVVGVGVTHTIFKVVGWGSIRVDLSWGISRPWSIGSCRCISWSRGIVWPCKGNSSNSWEGKNLVGNNLVHHISAFNWSRFFKSAYITVIKLWN